MISWPATLPVPLVDGYTGKAGLAFLRTDMDTGKSRQRKRFRNAPKSITMSWMFTSAQMSIFTDFWINSINEGADWFSMPLTVGNGLETRSIRFTTPYQDQVLSGLNFQVTGQMEVEIV